MNALPNELSDELFYLFAIGPGTGETTLLRIPPNQWVIVDSIKCDARPARKWATFRNESREIGDARLTSLHPAIPMDPKLFGTRPNEISSAIFVNWHELRLLLGADVPKSQWPAIAKAFPGLGDHAAMKVPHHGSKEAFHKSFAKGRDTRCWVVTPFASKGLPNADDGHGLDQMLDSVAEVHLTALPYAHDSELQSPCMTTRKQIRDNRRPQRRPRMPAAHTAADIDRHVIVSFDRHGQLQQIWHGPGSVLVSR